MKINVKTILFLVGLMIVSGSYAQRGSNEAVIRAIADRILAETNREFINTKTGEKYTNLKRVTPDINVRAASRYNDWHYTNGVLNIAMLELASVLDEDKYKEWMAKNMEFAFDKHNQKFFETLYNDALTQENKWRRVREVNWHMYFRMVRLDDYGTIAASLIDLNKDERFKKKEYVDYVNKVDHHIEFYETRLPDNTIARYWPHEYSVWADDLNMSVAFLARLGEATGDMKYLDEAAFQIVQFDKYLWSPVKEVYYHDFHTSPDRNGVAHWARANGWMLMAMADLLTVLPEDHPKREPILEIYNRFVRGIAKYQSANGLWHQLLDHNDSYLETSASAMFVFGIARGVRMGWIHPDFSLVASTGWMGVRSKIDHRANVLDICIGTGISPSLTFYYNRPVKMNHPMGEGPVIRAGIEILQMDPYSEVWSDDLYDRIYEEGKDREAAAQ